MMYFRYGRLTNGMGNKMGVWYKNGLPQVVYNGAILATTGGEQLWLTACQFSPSTVTDQVSMSRIWYDRNRPKKCMGKVFHRQV